MPLIALTLDIAILKLSHTHTLSLRHHSRAPHHPLRKMEHQIDVTMIFSELTREELGGISDEQMATIFTDAVASTNEAFVNSDIDLHFRLVHVGQVGILKAMESVPIDGYCSECAPVFSALRTRKGVVHHHTSGCIRYKTLYCYFRYYCSGMVPGITEY